MPFDVVIYVSVQFLGDDPNPLGSRYSLCARDSLCGSFRHRHEDGEDGDDYGGDDDQYDEDGFGVLIFILYVQECTPAWPEM